MTEKPEIDFVDPTPPADLVVTDLTEGEGEEAGQEHDERRPSRRLGVRAHGRTVRLAAGSEQPLFGHRAQPCSDHPRRLTST